MRTFSVVQYPHPSLRKKAVAVTLFDQRLSSVVRRMTETMYQNKGVGLAAPQVNLSERVIVFDASDERDQPEALINPVILRAEGSQVSEEGCLSIPDLRVQVPRALTVRVSGQDETGLPREFDADGLKAIVLQHEIDHLNGILILDYLPAGADLAAARERPSRLATR